jgi:uncharacterized protein DUF1569
MNSLADPGAIESLVTRLGKLHAERPRAWGRMTAHEMLCHLADSFELALGRRRFTPVDTWMRRTVMKRVALHTSLGWPQGIKMRPEVEQGMGGTKPADFEQDRARAVTLLRSFPAPDGSYGNHPFFGSLTREEWLIWGYRHTDHHLRQFAL